MQQQETGNNVRLSENARILFYCHRASDLNNLKWQGLSVESSTEGCEQVRRFYSHSSSIRHPAAAFIHAAADATDTVPLIDLSFVQPATLLWGR